MSVVDNILQECFRLLTLNQLDSNQRDGLFDIENNPTIFIEVPFLNADNINRKNSKIELNEYGYPRLGRTGLIEGGDFWVNRSTVIQSRYSNAGFTFTSNLAVTVGGRIPTVDTLLSSVEMYSNSSDVWLSKTNYIVSLGYQAGMSMTSNIGLVSTGYNGSSSGVGNTTSYYSSTNSWTGQASNPFRRYGAAGFGLTTDIAMISGGYNGNYITDIRSFTLSTNTWSSTMAGLAMAKHRHGNFCSLNGGIMAGGNNGSDSLDSVDSYRSGISTVKTDLVRKRFGPTGLSFNTFYGLLVGGSNSSGQFRQVVDGFNYDINTWTSRAELLATRYLSCGLSIRSDMGIICGGYPTYTTERYNNGCFRAEALTGGECLDSYRLFRLTSPDPPQKGIFITTKQLRNQKLPIYNVFVNVLASKHFRKDITYGISLDDGCTWIDGIKCGTIHDTKGLSPDSDGNYKLRLRFELCNNPSDPQVTIISYPPTESISSISNDYMEFLGFFATDFKGAKIDD